jgi:hypothetical protein
MGAGTASERGEAGQGDWLGARLGQAGWGGQGFGIPGIDGLWLGSGAGGWGLPLLGAGAAALEWGRRQQTGMLWIAALRAPLLRARRQQSEQIVLFPEPGLCRHLHPSPGPMIPDPARGEDGDPRLLEASTGPAAGVALPRVAIQA